MTLDLTFESTSRFVSLPSGKVHYNQAGEGPPVLLLHGSGPGATGWSNFGPNIVELAERFTCYAVDMPGWGESDAVTPDKRNHVQTALEFLDELGIDKAAFIGNSMGGATTIRFAVEHPERQSHLITMGAGAAGVKIFGAGDGPTEGLKILQKGYREPSMETMLELVDVMSYDSGDQREERARVRLESLLKHPDHVANFLAGARNKRDWPTEEQVAGIRVPALLIHGRDDRVVHFENSLRLVALIPDSRLLLLNRCGHWAQVEHAEEFNRVVSDFIENN
ncbi:alpha/beta fold hydrolase [Nocardioides sp. cx-169]|uniref:alpha/beta fold hydrolase n=1 Tax=Nocardioides sp. cx-169 TaxID=2899080 RepID=UPI001E2F70D8|nr:alpha/beta hydrolase [Nocardioides sp. cx-169]MCD4534314.1 alpha/beta fold hydrolase [Nocardioides sp. cx-169]